MVLPLGARIGPVNQCSGGVAWASSVNMRREMVIIIFLVMIILGKTKTALSIRLGWCRLLHFESVGNTMKPVIFVVQNKEGPIRRGHPWIFPKAILKQNGTLVTGELVEIVSESEAYIGLGIYNEHSLYRVRVLALAHELPSTATLSEIIAYRLNAAIQLRTQLLLPNQHTTAYRVFNSEGDGLSGLTIDRFNDVYVVSSTAYWIESHKASIIEHLEILDQAKKILWQSHVKSLKQDGWLQTTTQLTYGTETILESGIQFAVDFSSHQKTGLFLDQRQNHERIAKIASGKRILDLYSYSGGFALHAANAGALFVTAVDSSADAIRLAKHNADLNQLHQIEFIEADARDYLSKAGAYDLVVLDPPKLVPSKRHIVQAKNYYRFLHRELMKHMKKGALLMTCNCSSALSTQEFVDLVTQQAITVGKSAKVLGVYGPSNCHPTLAAFPEGSYLTAVLLAM